MLVREEGVGWRDKEGRGKQGRKERNYNSKNKTWKFHTGLNDKYFLSSLHIFCQALISQ